MQFGIYLSSDPPGLQLLVVLSQFPQLQLQPSALFGHRVQRLAGVRQFCLVGVLQARQLSAHLSLRLRDAHSQDGVLGLQRAHLINVDSQAVVEVGEVLLLLQPGDAVGGQRCVRPTGSVLWRCHFPLPAFVVETWFINYLVSQIKYDLERILIKSQLNQLQTVNVFTFHNKNPPCCTSDISERISALKSNRIQLIWMKTINKN